MIRVTDVTDFSPANRRNWRFLFSAFAVLSAVWLPLRNKKFSHFLFFSAPHSASLLCFSYLHQGGRGAFGGSPFNIQNFPISFPHTVFTAIPNDINSSGVQTSVRMAPMGMNTDDLNKTHARYLADSQFSGEGGTAGAFQWLAIGY